MKRIPDIAAYCGLYCGSCPNHSATKNGVIEEFAKRIGMPPEKAACDGCRSNRTPEWCGNCGLKACAKKKGLEFCVECEEYPCGDWIAFRDDPSYPYHKEAGGSLDSIRAGGVGRWIAEQEKRWKCTACSGSYTWFETCCPSCGTATKGYARPVG